jgi:fucose permease
MSSFLPVIGIRPRERIVFAMLFAGFILTGAVTTLLGPLLPVFIARWSLEDSRAGLFFTTQFMGSLAGTGLSSLLLTWKGYRPAIVLGFGFMAVGVAGLNLGSSGLALFATAVLGCGFGTAIPGTNLWVAEAAGQHRSSALNLMNLAWCGGALAFPAVLSIALKSNQLAGLLYSLAGGVFLLGLALLLTPFETLRQETRNASSQPALKRPGLLLGITLGLLFFLYVGTENGVSGWAAAHAKRIGSASKNLWALAPLFFWTALLVGRGAAPFLLLRTKERQLVSAGLILSAAGTALLLLAKTQATVFASVAAVGLGLATVYPTFIGWLAECYGERARSVVGAMFAMAAVGGSTLPWLVGWTSTRAGSLRVGLLVPLAGCLAMFFMVAMFRRQTRS